MVDRTTAELWRGGSDTGVPGHLELDGTGDLEMMHGHQHVDTDDGRQRRGGDTVAGGSIVQDVIGGRLSLELGDDGSQIARSVAHRHERDSANGPQPLGVDARTWVVTKRVRDVTAVWQNGAVSPLSVLARGCRVVTVR